MGVMMYLLSFFKNPPVAAVAVKIPRQSVHDIDFKERGNGFIHIRQLFVARQEASAEPAVRIVINLYAANLLC